MTIKENLHHKRDPNSFHNIAVSGWEIFCLNLTPFFCHTPHQKALKTLLRKAEYRLHKELNLGPLLHKLNECHNMVRSLALSADTDLRKAYMPHYSNTIQISMNTNKSLSFEDDAILNPIPHAMGLNITPDNIKTIGE